ncbi:hypothetical protein [Lacticaseibacillus absianus]|uniref:hypothetical protein n=1 Tax=Lacticaseibacillus absianus TaxID=2729623 RepID=UPI0015C6F6B0|nr:hypothetical protein [Lacticaseibacillus absianus]
MDSREEAQLQALRRTVLADSTPDKVSQVNGLLTLMFRKLEAQGFSAAYFRYSFWPQLAPMLEPTQQATVARAFEPFLQA